ncbi:MAG: hypothetical protein RBT63_04625 [Bdellovibrionales bacterium]|jgi:hypothetical protein|nr:hypothetical protein [Bdellovibrionales bacterium]
MQAPSQKQNRFVGVALIVVIGLGLTIEAMKLTDASSERSWRGAFGLSPDDEARAGLAVPKRNRGGTHGLSASDKAAADRARSRLLRGRLSGHGLGQTATLQPTTALPASALAGKAANLASPKLVKLDAKKKAELEKKKKNRRKKRKQQSEPENSVEVAVTEASARSRFDDTSDSTTATSGALSANAPVQTPSTESPTAAQTEAPETLEEWLAYILREPSYERTMSLINAHQSRQIDASIFHDVISEMLADSRAKMHEYAIYALGSSPSLRSFTLLQLANRLQPEGSKLKVLSRNHIKAYARIENLRYLAGVIAGESEYNSIFDALRLIQASAIAYAGGTPTATESGEGGGPKPVPTPLSVTNQFNPLVPILNRAAQTASDATLRQEASRALEQVQALVSATTAS